MPRCAVSIASATPNPCAHRCSRNRSVDSQSMTGAPPGDTAAATCAAAKTFRRVGGGYPASHRGDGMTSGPSRPGS